MVNIGIRKGLIKNTTASLDDLPEEFRTGYIALDVYKRQVLVKSAYSTNIKERKDCSCALFDAERCV